MNDQPHAEQGLFDAAAYLVPAETGPELSAGRRLTLRQTDILHRGQHPLSAHTRAHLPLHPQAAPPDDRDAPGRRCGSCFWKDHATHKSRTYGKCGYPQGRGKADIARLGLPRSSHGPGTDVRNWWPGCVDHSPGAPQLSDDAARWNPAWVGGEL